MSTIGASDGIDSSAFNSLDVARELSASSPLTNRIAQVAFQVASYLTDPVCKAHEYYRRLAMV